MESLLQRIALACIDPNKVTSTNPLEKFIPELNPFLEKNPKPILDVLTCYLFTPSSSSSTSTFTWNSNHVLTIYKYLIQYKSTLLIDISESVLYTVRQYLSTAVPKQQQQQQQRLYVSDTVLYTLLELLENVHLKIAENASQTLLALTLYHTFVGTSIPNEDGEEDSPSSSSCWEERLVQALLNSFRNSKKNTVIQNDDSSSSFLNMNHKDDDDEDDKKKQTMSPTTDPNHVLLHSTRIIRYASTLVQLLHLDWQYNKMYNDYYRNKNDNHDKKTKASVGGASFPQEDKEELVLPTWIYTFLTHWILQNNNNNIPIESTFNSYIFQYDLLDLFLIQPFYTHTNNTFYISSLPTQDVLGRMTLLDFIDSITRTIIDLGSSNTWTTDKNIVSWLYSKQVLFPLFYLLLGDSTSTLDNKNNITMDMSWIYMMIPPTTTTTTTTNTTDSSNMNSWGSSSSSQSLVHNFQQRHSYYMHEMKNNNNNICIGEEEEKGLILRILSHIFHFTFHTSFPSMNDPWVEEETLLESSKEQIQLYLWSGYHISLSYFLTNILPSGRRYDQEAKRLAFMDAISIYLTTRAEILSTFVNDYTDVSKSLDTSSSSSSQESGIVTICESWLNLRQAQGPMKASILGSIVHVLEQVSSPTLRLSLISCMGQVNGSTPGITILANLCRLSPSVEVRVSSYRCLYELIDDKNNPGVVRDLFQDSQLQFYDFISGKHAYETTKEGKEAKYLLLSKILEYKQEYSHRWLSESQWKELEQVVRNGPFSLPPASVGDPLLE